MTAIKPHKASIALKTEPAYYIVTQTPSEAATAVEEAVRNGSKLVEFTLGTPDPAWNGRSVWLDPNEVVSIAPPMNVPERAAGPDDDDD